jgi:type VI secretion system protein ImpL
MIFLKHIEGGKRGQVESFDLERIRIGRHADNDLKFNPDTDREVSGHHAEIVCQGELVTIRDLQSRNGTLVNGRRINQSTTLRDGDTIQFADTGPKVVFSLGEAAPGSGTIVVDRSKLTPAAPAPAKDAPAVAEPGGASVVAASASRWKTLTVPVALVVVVAAVLAVALWWSWAAFFIVLGVVAVAAVTVGAVWWWRRRRAAAASAEAPGTSAAHPGRVADASRHGSAGDQHTLRELRLKWTQALNRLRASKLGRQGDDAVAALPWLVALGERGAGKSDFIRAGNPPASVSTVREAVSGTRTCDWWFFDGAVVLDTPGRYTFPVDGAADGREWQEFLSLLSHSRPDEPLNGVLVVVAADALMGRSEVSLRDEATQIRRRLDDLARRTGVTPPIYLVVTKMDLVAGYGEFFTEVSDGHRGQAMGWVTDEIQRRESPTAVLRQALLAVTRQLDRLRLAVIDARDGGGPRLGRRFLFPEEFRALTRPLRTFAEALLRPNQYDETPWFRGIFFTAARSQGTALSSLGRALGLGDVPPPAALAPGPVFVRDLFSAILPQERELVRRSGAVRRQTLRRRRAALVAAGAAALVLGTLLTISFVRNTRALARLDLTPCSPSAGTAAASLTKKIQLADQCRAVIVGLAPTGFWNRLTTDFWLRQTERLEEPLLRRYVEVFRRDIDEPLDAGIDRAMAPGPAAPVVVSAVLQRIAFIEKCRADGRCPSSASSASPNYRVLLAASEPGAPGGEAAAESLRRSHVAYLTWLRDARALDEMRTRDVARVVRWLGADGLRTEWILASTSSQFVPVRSRDFWGWDGPLQVDSPFTKRAWAEAIQPLLSGLRVIAPDRREVQDALARFESDYRSEALRQWGVFLLNFPREERLLGGRRGTRDLAVRSLDANSPYRRVLETAASNVAAITAATKLGEELPAWADTLLRYVALQSKAPLAREPKSPLTDAERRALGYLNGYAQNLEQLRTELGGIDKAYQSVQKVFEEGEPSERSAHPLHRTLWNLQALRATIGASRGDDRIVWALLLRPAELVWRTLLGDAAQQVQGKWEALIPGLVGTTPGLQAAKIIEFANGPAAVLIDRAGDRYVLRRFLGEGAPLSPAFLDFISRLRWVPADRLDKIDPPRLIVMPS